MNMSLKTGIIPCEKNIAKITPLYKKVISVTRKWEKDLSFLVSGRGLACQQEILLVLVKTPAIHY